MMEREKFNHIVEMMRANEEAEIMLLLTWQCFA